MKDRTQEFDVQDAQNNKTMGILSYISFLVFVAIFSAKDSKWTRFHANQGLVIFIIEVASAITLGLLGLIPYVGIVFKILQWLVYIGCVVLSVLGIVNAAKGKAVEFPVIGNFKLLK